nr:MBG-2 domain-containing protein [Rubrobacteraceae bacterium]
TFQIAKANQTITFAAIANKTYGDPDFNVSATASSGLSVSFTATGNCSVSGNTVHLTGAGSCTITAKQAGNTNYNAAPDVSQTFQIAKANQTITFAAIANKTYGDPDFNVSATASSGLPVSFVASGDCTINASNTVHMTRAGSCTVTASQAGNADYNAATAVPQTFQIAKATATVNITWSNSTYDGSANAASASVSGVGTSPENLGAASLTYYAGSTATGTPLSGAPKDAGTYTVKATFSGNANYNPAEATRTITIAQRSISVKADAKTKILGAPDPALTYQVTSGSLVTGDSFSGQLTRDPGENVGTYAIKQGTLTAGPNYNLTFTGANLTIVYNYSGFLQPINDTAHQTGTLESKFRLGQTIPVKFIISNAAGTSVQQATNPTFTRSGNLGSCDLSTTLEDPPVVTPDASNQYIFTGGQYHYNWSTKGLTAGEYRIFVTGLADGTKPYVDICLTK